MSVFTKSGIHGGVVPVGVLVDRDWPRGGDPPTSHIWPRSNTDFVPPTLPGTGQADQLSSSAGEILEIGLDCSTAAASAPVPAYDGDLYAVLRHVRNMGRVVQRSGHAKMSMAYYGTAP